MAFIKYKKEKKETFYLSKNKLIIKNKLGTYEFIFPKDFIFINSKKIFIPKIKYFYFINILKNLFFSSKNKFFEEITLKGKGFKLFKYNSYFAFDLGYSNLFLYKTLHKNISVHATKQKLVIQSNNKILIKKLVYYLNNFYKIDKYHGKGIFISKRKPIFYKKLI